MKKFEFMTDEYLITDPNYDETMVYRVDPIEYYGKYYLDALEKFNNLK